MFGAIWSELFSVFDELDVLLAAAAPPDVDDDTLLVDAICFFFGVTTQFDVLSSEVVEIVTIFFAVSGLLSPSSI